VPQQIRNTITFLSAVSNAEIEHIWLSTGRIIVRADMSAVLGLMVLENRMLTSKEQHDPEESYALRTSLTCNLYILILHINEDEETGIYRARVSRKRNSNISTGISGRKNSFETLSLDGKIILICFFKQIVECPQVVTFPGAFSLSLSPWELSKGKHCILLFLTWDYVFRL
jgi:hypothetical protein